MIGFAVLGLVTALFGLGLIITSKNKRDGIRLLVVGIIGLIATFVLSAAYFRH
jgi:multisubunit Na+/H+ antiporter MnhB subunit